MTPAVSPGRRIAILGSRGYPSTYGGFETLVRRLAPDLAAHGNHVSVYSRDPGHPLRWSATFVGDVRRVVTPGLDTKSASTLTHGITASVDAVFRGYDAVLVLNVANGYFIPLLRARGIPTVVNVDGMEWERAKWNRAARRVFRTSAALVARFADEIIVDSKAIGDRWSELFGRRGVYIPYGADVLGPRPTTRVEALGLEPGAFGLVVARLVPENNIDLVLDAIDATSAPFVVVGDANYGNPVVRRLQEMQARRPSFRWLGHVSDQDLLADLWAHCGVYVHGHSVGGTNPSLLQALGAGSPVVAFDTAYNREVLECADQLFGSSRELAGRIQSLLSDASTREKLGVRGPLLVRTRYPWDACLCGYGDLLAKSCKR